MPKLLGIVNVTQDSFSDGGAFLEPEKALAQAEKLRAGGADIIDIGAASSHPDARAVSAAEEIDRLREIVPPLLAAGYTLSVDSFQPETQLWALAEGVQWLNDINGFATPEIYPTLAKSSARLIVMHAINARGIATRAKAPADIWARICHVFAERLATLHAAGIAPARLVLDPGMGFFLGDDPQNSFTVLREISRLRARFDLPILVSVSRKSFLRAARQMPPCESGAVTLAAELYAAARGVDYIRTHDVAPLCEALEIWEKLQA